MSSASRDTLPPAAVLGRQSTFIPLLNTLPPGRNQIAPEPTHIFPITFSEHTSPYKFTSTRELMEIILGFLPYYLGAIYVVHGVLLVVFIVIEPLSRAPYYPLQMYLVACPYLLLFFGW